MPITLDEGIKKLAELRAKGFVKSRRRGPTGVGHTLEQELGLDENNLSHPDFGKVELKTNRSSSTSMLTLFTMDKGAWILAQSDAIKRFGTTVKKDSETRINLYQTIGVKTNASGFRLIVQNDAVIICSARDEFLAKWSLQSLANKFNEKTRHILYVTADTKKIEGIEYFWYKEATLMSGIVSEQILGYLLDSGAIVIDVRMHLKPNGKVRNHGTGFRIAEKEYPTLFGLNEPVSFDHPNLN